MKLSLKWLLVRNTAVQLAAQAVHLAAGFIVTVVLSRYLGVQGFGKYNYIFAFFFIFYALNDFGGTSIIIREASQNKNKLSEMVGTVLIFKIAAALVLMVLAWAVISAMNFPPDLRAAMRLYALSLPVIALELPIVVFQVHLNLLYPSLIAIAYRLVHLALTLAAVWLHGDLKWIIAASLAAEIIYMLFLCRYANSFSRLVWAFDKKFLIQILKPSLIVWGTGILIAVIKRADFIMLERMKDLTQVGLYAAANRIPALLEILPLILMNTLFPVMSACVREDMPQLKRLYRKVVFGMSAVAAGLGTAIAFLAPRIVSLIFGAAFQSSAPALSVLIGSTAAIYISITGGNLLVCAGMERTGFWLQLLTVAVNIILNFLWIPRFGFLGAAWATTLASLVSCVTVLIAVEHFFKIKTVPGAPA